MKPQTRALIKLLQLAALGVVIALIAVFVIEAIANTFGAAGFAWILIGSLGAWMIYMFYSMLLSDELYKDKLKEIEETTRLKELEETTRE